MRIVSTPLDAPLAWPPSRDGALGADLRAAVLPHADIAASVELLGKPGTLAVTTGQQPGLFTGPLYTIYKALSAAALARRLQAKWQRAVVPVFWIAGDDHDWEEASTAAWLNADGTVVSTQLPARSADASLTPMFRELLGPAVESSLSELAESISGGEGKDLVLGWLGRHYRPEQTVAAAFGNALAELLAPLGVLCLDSTHPTAKAASVPVLLDALRQAAPLDQDLARRAAELERAGKEVTVPVGEGATLVFLEDRLGRDRLVKDGDGFVTRRAGTRLTFADLERIAATEPERLSPNVLLRPVVESAILPTVAYVGGPGELKYLALTPPIYARLGIPPQRPLPRWSGLLVEPRVDRVLDKFGATLEEILLPGAALEARVVRAQLPPGLLEAIAQLRLDLDEQYRIIDDAARSIDPTLEKPVGSARGASLNAVGDIEKKITQHLKKREATEVAQIARVRTAVQPNGAPQERVLTVAPFLARYGSGLLQELRETIDGWYADTLNAEV